MKLGDALADSGGAPAMHGIIPLTRNAQETKSGGGTQPGLPKAEGETA